MDNAAVSLLIALDGVGELGIELMGAVPPQVVSHCALWHDGLEPRLENQSDILVVTHSDNCNECTMHYNGPILLVLRDEEPPPSSIPTRNAPVILARRTKGLHISQSAIASHIASTILQTSAWASLLSSLRPPSTIQDMVDFSAHEFNGCIIVVDESSRICACTQDVSFANVPPWLAQRREEGLRLIRDAAANGPQVQGSQLEHVFGKDAFILADMGIVGAPLQVGSTYHGQAHLVLENKSAPSSGVVAKFEMFASRCALLASRQKTMTHDVNQRRARLLDRLVDNTSIDAMELGRESTAVGLPLEGSYRLVLVDGPHNALANTRSLMTSSLQARFPKSTPFTHAGETLLLVLEQDKSMSLGADLLERLGDLAHERDCICYSSDVVGSLKMLWYAYGEVASCRMLKRDIALARAPWKGTMAYDERIFQFYESVLFFYSQKSVDAAFLNESYQAIPLQSVIEHDHAHGTDDLVVLYCYLSLEQGISTTAQRTHMHRNNVRYRIDSMRRRYGFDLSNPFVRMRLLNDFRLLISQSPEFAESLMQRLG